jgi:hypothetical protein
VAAGAIQFTTGDVEKDMAGSDVLTIVNHPLGKTGVADPNYYKNMQAEWMTNAGRVNGWAIKDLRFLYDQPNDRLYVGVNFYGVAGDAYGDGLARGHDSSHPNALPNHLGLGAATDQTITVGIDLTNSGTPTFLAGTPSDRMNPALIGPGTDGFSLNWYKSAGVGLGASYDATRPSLNADHNGNLAFEPSVAHPDFEFVVSNLSKIPGFDITKGIGVQAFAGTSADIDVGEDSVPYTHISFETTTIPEPATVLAWSFVLAGATWRGVARRRKGEASRS